MPFSARIARYLPLTRLCLSLAAAVGAQLLQPSLWPQWIYLSLCLVGALCMAAWGLRRHSPTAVLLAGAALLGFGSTGWRAGHYAASILPAHLQQRDIVVQGQVRGLPQWLPNGVRFAFAVERATLDGETVKLPDTISLAWYRPWTEGGTLGIPPDANEETVPPGSNGARCSPCVAPGERWQLAVRLKQPHGSRNPFGFDYELWLWEQGLGATGHVRANGKQDSPQKLGHADALDVRAWRDHARLHAREAVYRTLLPPSDAHASAAYPDAARAQANGAAIDRNKRVAGIVAALLMGDQRAIEQSDWLIFRRTGISHLLSISGLHITLFAWLAGICISLLWRQSARLGWSAPCLWLPASTAALWGGVALATAYAWFSGWGIPAQRTCIMLLCVAALRAYGLKWPWWSILATAAAAVSMLDPWALLQAGFWLSFVAVGVLFASSPEHSRKQRPERKISRALNNFLQTQLAILLALTPLSLLLFGQFSLVGFIANAVAVPLITFMVTPLVLLGMAWRPLWQLAAHLLQAMLLLLQRLADLPWASYQVAIAPWWAGVAGIACGLMVMLRLPWAWRLGAALGLLPVLLWQAPRPAHGQFELLAADVGQGSAILVRTRTHSLLFDAGPQYSASSDAGERVLLPLLDALDEHPDWLLLSHEDSDHVGGARALLEARPRMQTLGAMQAAHPLQSLRPVMPCSAGQVWQWDGVTFSILHPAEYNPDHAKRADNEASCVLHISNGKRAAMLAGDIGTAQEQAIIDQQRETAGNMQADILLVGHHGSKTSTSNAWLDAVQPRWAVIQQGYLNRYKHPHPIVLKRLHARRIAVMLSESCGAAWWHSSNNALRCERETNRRYWQHQPARATPPSGENPPLSG